MLLPHFGQYFAPEARSELQDGQFIFVCRSHYRLINDIVLAVQNVKRRFTI